MLIYNDELKKLNLKIMDKNNEIQSLESGYQSIIDRYTRNLEPFPENLLEIEHPDKYLDWQRVQSLIKKRGILISVRDNLAKLEKNVPYFDPILTCKWDHTANEKIINNFKQHLSNLPKEIESKIILKLDKILESGAEDRETLENLMEYLDNYCSILDSDKHEKIKTYIFALIEYLKFTYKCVLI